MEAKVKRYLGDAFLVTSWCLYVALFFALWAPLLPEWIGGAVLLGAIVAGHTVGQAWKRKVTGRTPVAARWLAGLV